MVDSVLGKRKANEDEDGFQKVERKGKKPKTGPPQIFHSPSMRIQTQIKIRDVQQLILYLLANDSAPQWIAVSNKPSIKQVVLLMVPGLELGMLTGQTRLESLVETAEPVAISAVRPPSERKYTSPDEYYPVKLHKEHMPPVLQSLAGMFPHVWPVKAPGDDHYSKVFDAMYDMLNSTFPKTAEEKSTKGPMTSAAAWKHGDKKRTPITHFLSDFETLIENDYVPHPAMAPDESTKKDVIQERQAAHQGPTDGWVDTNVRSLDEGNVPDREIQAGSVTAGRQIYAMDCEFVKVEGNEFAAARISVIDWDGETVLDELIRPDKPITDYLTEFSGMTKEKLDPVSTTLAEVQARLVTILTPRAILMGHSLDSDLSVIKMTHPFIIDTSILFPHPLGPPKKSALKWLTKKYLARDIQNSGNKGHDSIEDARAVLDLIKQKCERGLQWGTSAANTEPIFKRLSREPRPDGLVSPDKIPLEVEHRRTAMADWGSPHRGVGGSATKSTGCHSDAEIVKAVTSFAQSGWTGGDDDDTSQQFDFIFARMRELEAVRGWWWRSTKSSTELDELRTSTLGRYGIKETPEKPHTTPDLDALKAAVMQTTQNIASVYNALMPGTALVVFSGTGDKREMHRLQGLQQQFNREYKVKKWSELSVKWTDTEAQGLRAAVRKAREGVGLIVVKPSPA